MQTTIGVGCKRVVVCGVNHYGFAVQIHIRLLLRVGIKVADEW